LSRYICDFNDEMDNLKKFRYLSFYKDDGQFLEEISLEQWRRNKVDQIDTEGKKTRIREMMDVLNGVEKKVVDLCLQGRKYKEVAQRLKIKQDRVRQIFYRAKEKLVKEYCSWN
jgi:RNA polymerase sigma factor (sigma-70 family)